MAQVEIYTRPMCNFCFKAKKLLSKKGVNFVEYDIWEEEGRKAEMTERTGGATTVPQVFVDGAYVGDCERVLSLEDKGELDHVLAGA